jgi:hypothetical protein
MMDLAKEKELDPRFISTWPVSPNYQEAMLLSSGRSEGFVSYGSATKNNKNKDINIQSDGPQQ